MIWQFEAICGRELTRLSIDHVVSRQELSSASLQAAQRWCCAASVAVTQVGVMYEDESQAKPLAVSVCR